ncbi:aldo-keto reductase family 1 member A1-like [Bactrocera neohumeralis]|uniref:aldo-keto reductase family 1 member A1-like n=1 Tax=Bactrocera tryoni TaxID=59916 RepID=UPI001A95981A|nr:aldo-keto reductase family 1 member A1-like [Bactrocera tryoni]XP_050316813.1 aldo-keto reductase family 1 member A1-like [Bactrocera neohumeralis]
MAFNKFLRLSNGPDMPAFGLRLSQVKRDDVSVVLNDAIEAGYRLFETSPSYNNQSDVGDVLTAWLKGNKIRREELFIVTNLPVSNNRPHEVEDTLKESLKKLKLDYVDLYLVEAPFAIKMENEEVFKRDSAGNALLEEATDHVAIWEIMEELMSTGLTKSIGLGNFNVDQIQHIVETRKMIPHVLQIEYHVYLQQPELIDYCRRANITLLTYAALGAVNKPDKYQRVSVQDKDEIPILDLPELREIAAAHKKTPAQVAFRWVIDKKMALTVKSSNNERIRSNIDIFDFSLTKEEMEKLNALDRNRRFVDFSQYKGIEKHPDYPFHT